MKPLRFENHGLSLLVAADEISVVRGDRAEPLLSVRAFEAARFQQDFPSSGAPGQSDVQRCARHIRLTPVAWTGQILSVSQLEETGCKLEAHPAGEARFITWLIDSSPREHASMASLRTWYSESELLAALNRDPLVKRALASDSRDSLTDLLQSLADAAPVTSGRSCYQFPNDLLERFAPSHVDGKSLAVRLSLPGAAVCRNQLTELGISLPLPRQYRAALEEASQGRNGFLERNVPAALAQHPVVIELGSIPFAEAHP